MAVSNDRPNRAIRRALIRERLNAIKVERGCVDCGYRAHPAALDFDHVEGKRRGLSQAARHQCWSWIAEEMARCEVVCSNCHRIRTAEKLGWYRHVGAVGSGSDVDLEFRRHGPARSTHCIRGHELTPENTIQSKRGRRCRACENAAKRKRYRANRNAAHHDPA